MSVGSRVRRAALAAGILIAAPPGVIPAGPPDPDQPLAAGDLAWLVGGELDLVGLMRAEIPRPVGDGRSVVMAVDARTSISQTSTRFGFRVFDLDYRVDVGYRQRTVSWGGVLLGALGQSGSERADAPGQPWVRYALVGLESPGFRERRRGLAWRLAAGPVLDEREVRADGVLRGRLSASIPGGRGPLRFLDLELGVDGLLDGGRFAADLELGPGLALRLPSGEQVRLFAHHLDAENPLGVNSSGWLVGVRYADAGGPALQARAPEVGGSLWAGSGDRRAAGRFVLRLTSPEFLHETRGVIEVDANLLTAEDTGELYYRYHVGLERPLGRRLVAGAYFYHRSNHTLAEPNRTITIVNILECGIESDGWDRPGTAGRIEGRFRGGWLTNGSFGEDRRWHVRGGVRLAPWRPARGPIPFAHLEAEEGDVGRRLAAVGVTFAERLELRFEAREDDQYFSRDNTARLVTIGIPY